MGEKFLGVGIKNAIGISFFVMLVFIIVKTILSKHYVEGASETVMFA